MHNDPQIYNISLTYLTIYTLNTTSNTHVTTKSISSTIVNNTESTTTKLSLDEAGSDEELMVGGTEVLDII